MSSESAAPLSSATGYTHAEHVDASVLETLRDTARPYSILLLFAMAHQQLAEYFAAPEGLAVHTPCLDVLGSHGF